jgi:hypothetical protein
VSLRFEVGDRVVTNKGTKATVISPSPDQRLVLIKLDDAGTCFMEPEWLMHLNPVEWLAEIALPRRRWKPGERVSVVIDRLQVPSLRHGAR